MRRQNCVMWLLQAISKPGSPLTKICTHIHMWTHTHTHTCTHTRTQPSTWLAFVLLYVAGSRVSWERKTKEKVIQAILLYSLWGLPFTDKKIHLTNKFYASSWVEVLVLIIKENTNELVLLKTIHFNNVLSPSVLYRYLLNESVNSSGMTLNKLLFCNGSWVDTSLKQPFPNFAVHENHLGKTPCSGQILYQLSRNVWKWQRKTWIFFLRLPSNTSGWQNLRTTVLLDF